MGLLVPLALAALPLLGLIVALYLLKLRRPSAPVGSLQLWGSLTRDREANALWQRLRVSPLMLLQLTVLLLLILALGRPWVATQAEPLRNAVLVVDTSASMASLDGDSSFRTSRLAAAKRHAQSLLDSLPPGSKVSLIAADTSATIVVPATEDKARLRAAIEAIQPSVAETDLASAMKLASALTAESAQSEVQIFTDGAYPPLRGRVDPVRATIRVTVVGVDRPNQGLTALALQQQSGSASLFLQVANSDVITATRRIDFTVDGDPWTARTIEVGPGGTAELLVPDLPLDARVLRAELAGRDALDLDNSAWVINRASVPATVLLVTEGNKFLELALSMLPTVTLYKVRPADYRPEATVNGSTVDMTIFDAGMPVTTTARLPDSNMLFFAPGDGAPIAAQQVITSPRLRVGSPVSQGGPGGDEYEGDPLLRFVDLSGVTISEARPLAVADWTREVVGSDKGAMLVAGELDGRKVAAFAFDLRDSDLSLHVAFPLLMRNLMTFLLPEPSGGLPAQVKPGQPVGIEAYDERVDRVLIEDPDAQEHVLAAGALNRSVVFGETQKPGVYYVIQYAGDTIVAQEAFAVNLFSRDETLSRPQRQPSLPEQEVATVNRAGGETGEGAMTARELWPVVALAGLLVLLVEWLYAQRIVVRRAVTEWRARRAVRGLDRS